MTPDPKSLAVLLDAARACYGDDSEQVRWLENPEAVRELLAAHPVMQATVNGEDGAVCPECYGNHGDAHQRICRVAAAWRALGDPRGAADIERAHEEALRLNTRTLQDLIGERFLPVNGANEGDTIEVQVGAGGRMSMLGVVARTIAIVDHENGPATHIPFRLPPLPSSVDPDQSTSEVAAQVSRRFRLASESAEAARARGLSPEQVEQARRCTHRYGQTLHAGQTRCDRCADRSTSDARGMEAVEAEARMEETSNTERARIIAAENLRSAAAW